MKIFQCIRAYDLYIPSFEERYQIKENNYSFSEIRNLLIKDGFASTYILQPAFDNNKEFFFTFWNYKTLQLKWAEENGLKTTDLNKIRVTQVETFKPDVYYNFSPYHDNKEIQKILDDKKLIKVCWDAVIKSYPLMHEKYDLRLTLHEPYVKFWKQNGYDASLLPPAFPVLWNNLDNKIKDVDILFYGQYADFFFSKRNLLLRELLKWSRKQGYNFKLYLQLPKKNRPLINIKGFRRLTNWLPPVPLFILKNSEHPIYGQELYETIARSKIVVNAFTNYNGMFKDNMRNYEAIGCGSLLISEEGIYPENFIPNKDFYTYRSSSDLFERLDQVLSSTDQGFEMARAASLKLSKVYTKNFQWNNFLNVVKSL